MRGDDRDLLGLVIEMRILRFGFDAKLWGSAGASISEETLNEVNGVSGFASVSRANGMDRCGCLT